MTKLSNVSRNPKVNNHDDRIRVLHLIHTLEIGGAQKVIVNLIRGMDKSRFDLSTVCLRKKGPIYEEIKSMGGKVCQIPKKGKFDLSIVSRLKKHIQEEECHILHTHNFSAGLWGRLAAMELKGRRPILVHTEHGRLGEVQLWRKIIMRYLARHTDMIVAVADETRDYLLHSIKIPETRVIVIKNGIDLNYLLSRADQKVDTIDEILEKNPGARFIINVSALSPVKDHATLLRAFKRLLIKLPDVHLLLVGDGPLRLELTKLASSLGIDGNVQFLGERHDIGAILAKSDIFVLSSLNEGTPISLLEAMGMGVTPVVTSVGGLPEMIENTVNGLMVPPSDPALLADAIRFTLENPEYADEWARKSKDMIRKEYTAEVMSEKHEELYLRLMSMKFK